MKIVVINGPNLNFLGIREPHIYGHETLKDLEEMLINESDKYEGLELSFFQSNSEGALIDFMQQCYYDKVEGIIMNPGALTHYSYALADAIKSVSIPVVEVHISNIHARESFRSHSVTAANSIGIIGGFGFEGYSMALEGIVKYLNKQHKISI